MKSDKMLHQNTMLHETDSVSLLNGSPFHPEGYTAVNVEAIHREKTNSPVTACQWYKAQQRQ